MNLKNKPDTKDYISYDSIYRECLEREILRDRKKISSCLRTEAEKRDSANGHKGSFRVRELL